ncbi:MAG TPA: FmdB family zinc ribbon protein [Terriglobales bacterium]|nr:FmdB family zinc ribbon protein [Terriglobales bacterium]
MPLYEYECTRCHKRVEKIQSFSAEPLRECAYCGGELEKLISAPAIQFKGSGWYVTDYAKSSGSSAPSRESKDAKPAADSKPAESTPAATTTSAASTSKPSSE